MEKQNPYEAFQKESPEVFEGFNGLVESLMNTKALDQKTKQLIYLGIKVAQGDQTAVMFHVPMAKKLGATRDEIKETILLTLTVCGLKGVNTCLAQALDIYDNDLQNPILY
ncbi:carboxymuconolactone decarboxylase family protein [Flavobacterium cerinum]|uniref:Carboxymuconolactone decarboxylase family protein n=1 Tax=Flavobacterium cerinum TaxID=2502784 RepID=A0A444HAJ6_9FLAO|nr:carboxymuconolactone decarboxylase family protein [Flavobacterium cerinum]RWX00318.1 carboxymuconolactone decarboxylase family protein [Flavobacterium cerinum]